VDTYRTVLFLHFVALFIGFGAAAILGFAISAACRADRWDACLGAAWRHVEKAFPVAILGLFLTGAYMTSDVWTWSTGDRRGNRVSRRHRRAGVLVAGRRAKELEHALEANGPGPLSNVARQLTCDRALWIVSFANPGSCLASFG